MQGGESVSVSGVRGSACPDELFGKGETGSGRGPVQGRDAIPVRVVSRGAAGEEFPRRVFLSRAQGGGEQGLFVPARALAYVGSGATLNSVIMDKISIIKPDKSLCGTDTFPVYVGKGIVV